MKSDIFHILEIDVPLNDGGMRRYWYGSVSTDDGVVKMMRINDIKDWETFINRRSGRILENNQILSNYEQNFNKNKPNIFF
ncbi:hypothetical protein TpMuguga_02g00614 [Theileria parva strain Muguga]|uniref:Uncharacterized protein n=1 Tax=Theileria parva TaxID=5875 RepID=Q4N4M6_THEPA|nr:uncharacterized protein TpMuguga_02g00614 [Theileria parva strain Muguga]EAN32897.1 hypothetical protein TpMuguga_02g00614 [Theileria parva strain Muguga]|eukprot:XP_765180.1 hypothetical protein [Theileria parva strain Muguga]